MTELIQQTDFQILDWIQANLRTPWLDWLMPKITFLCEGGWFWIVLTIVLLIWKRHRKCGWGMFTALILSLLIGNLLLKHAVARPRPCWINTDIDMLVAIPKDFSFPSGHSMASFASATVLMTYDRRAGMSGGELRAEVMANYLRHEHLPDGTFLSENARYQQTYGMLPEEGVIIQQSYNKSQAASFLAA